MHILIAKQRGQEQLTKIFTDRACIVEYIAPEDAQAYLEYGAPVAVITPVEYLSRFRKAAQETEVHTDHPIALIQSENSDHIPESFLAQSMAQIAIANGHEDSHILRVKDVTLDMMQNHVTVKDKKIDLNPKEHQFLRALMIRTGQALSKEDLLTNLYLPDEEPKIKILNTYLLYIRNKMKNVGGDPEFITTLIGEGFSIRLAPENRKIKHERGPIKCYHDGGWTITAGGEERELELSPSKKTILNAIMGRPDATIATDYLKTLISENDIGNSVLPTQISHLRANIAEASKCEEYPDGIDVIRNVLETGYKWRDKPVPYEKREQKQKQWTLRPHGMTIEWPGQLQIDTVNGTITNLGSQKTAKLTPKQCEAFEFTIDHPSWKTSTNGAPNHFTIASLRRKTTAVGYVNPAMFFQSGKTRNSAGYSFIGNPDVTRAHPNPANDKTSPDNQKLTAASTQLSL